MPRSDELIELREQLWLAASIGGTIRPKMHQVEALDEALTHSNDEPTEAMIEAAIGAWMDCESKKTADIIRAIYNAMRSAC